MKQLILMRHAKSSWDEPDVQDISRTLNERGHRGAALLGEWMQREGRAPDQVIVSAATRCRQTWDGIAATLDATPEVLVERALYMAGPEEMLEILRQRATGERVLLLAHMPGIGMLARAMRSDPPPDTPEFRKYPTGTTTVLDVPLDSWAQLGPGIAHLDTQIGPRELGL